MINHDKHGALQTMIEDTTDPSADTQDDPAVPGRTHGVEFEGFEDELATLEYPTTAAELATEYADHEIRLPDGSTTVGAILETLTTDDTETRYDSSEAVRRAICGTVGCEAVGRQHYSDRGSTALNDHPPSF